MHNSEPDVIRPVAPSLDEPEGISPTVEVELRRLAQRLEDTSLSPAITPMGAARFSERRM